MKEVEHMNIELRLETPADYAETEKVVREAFWNVYARGLHGALPGARHAQQ